MGAASKRGRGLLFLGLLLFAAWRLFVIILIVGTGVLSNRVSKNSSILSAIRLPDILSGLRDSVVGESYSFTDPAFVAGALKPGSKVTVNNTYGSIKIIGG